MGRLGAKAGMQYRSQSIPDSSMRYAILILALTAVLRPAQAEVTLPSPFDRFSATDVAAVAFGVLAERRETWLTDARRWDRFGEPYLAVIAEAARPERGGGPCDDCMRPLRLALLRLQDGELHLAGAAIFRNVDDTTTVFLSSVHLLKTMGGEVSPPLTGIETQLPVLREWSEDGRLRAEIILFRAGQGNLAPIFRRRVFDDPTPVDPDASGMRARLEIGELDPGGLAGFADIRVSEGYFARFAGDLIELDDQRIEVWVFGDGRYSLVQCEETGPMGYGPCVQ